MESKVTSNLNVLSTLENNLPKRKNNKKLKNTYIAWEDNASTSSDSSSEDVANVCLRAYSMDDSSPIEEI